MSKIEDALRKAHDTLNCRVRDDGRSFKTVDDYERDAYTIMHVCWIGADRLAALESLALELAGALEKVVTFDSEGPGLFVMKTASHDDDFDVVEAEESLYALMDDVSESLSSPLLAEIRAKRDA